MVKKSEPRKQEQFGKTTGAYVDSQGVQWTIYSSWTKGNKWQINAFSPSHSTYATLHGKDNPAKRMQVIANVIENWNKLQSRRRPRVIRR